jgi:hypothetical protein
MWRHLAAWILVCQMSDRAVLIRLIQNLKSKISRLGSVYPAGRAIG